MLHADLASYTPATLRDAFEAIFQDEDDWPESATVQDVQDGMPGFKTGDIAWIYVNLDSLEAEAITIVVNRAGATLTVRELEFGRP